MVSVQRVLRSTRVADPLLGTLAVLWMQLSVKAHAAKRMQRLPSCAFSVPRVPVATLVTAATGPVDALACGLGAGSATHRCGVWLPAVPAEAHRGGRHQHTPDWFVHTAVFPMTAMERPYSPTISAMTTDLSEPGSGIVLWSRARAVAMTSATMRRISASCDGVFTSSHCRNRLMRPRYPLRHRAGRLHRRAGPPGPSWPQPRIPPRRRI